MLEALAHGLPVVCLGLGGPAQIIDSYCGRVIAVQGQTTDATARELAQRLRDLNSNPGLRQSLSINAQQRAREFEFRRLVEDIYGTAESARHEAGQVASA